jgi:uncharacterized membrane protein
MDNRSRSIGLALLALPILFNLILLSPEMIVGVQPVNDHLLHQAASQRAGEALFSGENPLDAWVGDFSLGYPLWRSYPPLPHFVTGILSRLASPFAEPSTIFLLLHYLLLSLLPAAFFLLAWELGLGWIASGAAAALSITLSGAGQFGRFGLSYGAQLWRGSGLYTQLWGITFALLGLALFLRLLRTGKWRVAAGVLLACACLSHFVAGYVAVVSAAWLSVFRTGGSPASSRLFRLLTTGLVVVLLTAFFVVPLALDSQWINHSRWEDSWKWDSFGATTIVDALIRGTLLDEGRLPVFTVLLFAGFLIALWRVATRQASPSVAVLAVFWLLLFFGRETWGHLLKLFAVPDDMHVHRFQMAFEVFAVLLAGLTVGAIVDWLRPQHSRRSLLLACAAVAALLAPLYWERLQFVQMNTRWGLGNLWAQQSEAQTLEPLLAEVERLTRAGTGRVHAGKAASWGGSFKVGSTPVHGLLAKRRLPGSSFLYHSMSLASDTLVLMDDNAPADLALFGVRYVVAPSNWPVPPHVRFLSGSGRFRLYEVPGAGLFDVVDVPFAFEGRRQTFFEPSRAWLGHPLRQQNQYVAIYPEAAPAGLYRSVLHRWDPLPPPTPDLIGPAGMITGHSRAGETYQAAVVANRSAHVLFRSSFHPGLKADIDGNVVSPVMVTPGLAAFPITPGQHQVRVYYEAGTMKSLLLWLGLAGFLALVRISQAGHLATAEAWFGSRLLIPARWYPAAWPVLWSRHRLHVAIVLVLALVSLRPLYRGLLVSGHDGAEYPPRLVEFHENVRSGNLFPLWAPDLGNGHGQPLFQFVPPVAYWAAEVFYTVGARLADAIQWGALALGLLAGLALYGMGVALGSRGAGLVMAAAYLFSPYYHVNLFVRANFMEAAAIAMLPLAAAALWWGIDRQQARAVALGGAGVALFLLSHNATSLLGLPLLIAFAIAFAGFDLRRLYRGGTIVALSLALAAWFLVPALVEKHYVHVDRLRQGYLHYSGHFVSLSQLIFSRWGYGLSVPGSGDGMSFMLGPVHLLLGALGAILALRAGRSQHLPARVGMAAAVAVVIGAWIATPFSRFLWDAVPTLQYVEFPWRALAVPSLGLALLAGLFISLLPAARRLRAIVVAISVVAIVAANLSHAAPSGFLTFDDEHYSPERIARLGMNTTTREEYEPRTVKQRPAHAGAFVAPLACDPYFRVDDLVAMPDSRSMTVISPGPCKIRLNLFAYPQWTVSVNGRTVTTRREDLSGRIEFDVPSGRHQVAVRLEHTPLRLAARMVSLAALIFALFLLVRNPSLRGTQFLRLLTVGSRSEPVDQPLSIR